MGVHRPATVLTVRRSRSQTYAAYQRLPTSITLIRAVCVETASNLQFAVNPRDGEIS